MGSHTAGCEAALGEQLALQHRHQAAEYGWSRDNTIGSTPQLNGWSQDWLTFFRERRLRCQLQLAASKGAAVLLLRGEMLLERLDGLFDGYRPVPSLLHGDLWGGNWAVDERGQPVIFDPATYYGDREADLAMTRLFGGFGIDFYRAYEANWPLHPGVRRRTVLYNLYHVLNHFNLFGGGYLAQAMSMMDSLLR
jgi:fructosamine-3-kinase